MTEPLIYDFAGAAAKLHPVVTESWLKRHVKELPHRKFGNGSGRAGRVGFTQADLEVILARYAVMPDAVAEASDGRITRRRSA